MQMRPTFLHGAVGEAERAARLWGAAQTLHETKGIPRDLDFLAEADTRISAVRSGMGEIAWEEAWRKGRAMTLEEAVSYALEGRKGQAADAFFRVGEVRRTRAPDTTLIPPGTQYGATLCKPGKRKFPKYAAFATPCKCLQRLTDHS